MAIFHVATNTPPKSELIGAWLRRQPWGPVDSGEVDLLGSFHLDDPEGQVGMQVFVVRSSGGLFQVPLTYRDSPLVDGEAALLGEMEHSVLGTRFVYDGLSDERFVTVLAGVAVSGYGQALGFAKHEGRWHSVADELIVRGAGTLTGRVIADGFTITSMSTFAADDTLVFCNERIEMTVFRQLGDHDAPAIGLTTIWPGRSTPATLVAVREV